MSSSNATSEIRLTVEAEEPGTEIFLLDDQFRLKERSVGRLDTRQSPGVYKIKLRAGYETREEIILLQDEPVERHYPALAFYSPIPLEGTGGSIKSQAEAAERLSREAKPIAAGEGSRIFIFARDYIGGGVESPEEPVAENPAAGLSLKNVAGKMLVDLAEKSEVCGGPEPWAACAVEVAPGPYVLSLKTPGGEMFEQIIYAPLGWHAQVFLTQRLHESRRAEGQSRTLKIPDLPGAALLLTSSQDFNANDGGARLVELARISFSNRRRVLTGELRKMLYGKFEHPMLGIYGAHLLLLEKELDVSLYNQVVNNLRGIFKDSHPDVEALSLATNEDATSYVFNLPPMLRRSWSLVVKATVRRPDLVPIGSKAAQVADCVLGTKPWMTWMQPREARLPVAGGAQGEDAPRTDLEAALEAFIVPYTSQLLSLPALLGDVLQPQHPVYTKVISYVQGFIAKIVNFVSSKYGMTLEHWAMAGISELKLNEEQIKTLVEHLELPRYNVENLLNKSARRIQGKLNSAQAAEKHKAETTEAVAVDAE
jgi:hypothetical protein